MTPKSIVNAFLKKLSEDHYHEVDIRFTDVIGFWRHLTVPAGTVNKSLFSRGIGFDGSSIEAMTPTEAGDLSLIPDPRRAFPDPFAEKPTLALIANIVHPDTRKPFSRDPRSVAKKAKAYLKNSGFATESYWAPEFEFYLFDNVSYWKKPDGLGFSLKSVEAPENSVNTTSMGLVHSADSAYHMMSPVDSLHDVRAEIAYQMMKAGIQVKYHHHETGKHGQVEVEVNFAPFMSAADNIMLTKHIIRNVALRNNLAATFMPKPLPEEPGSGMHFHMYFIKGDERLFYDKEGYCFLSATARSAIAGILHHAPALCAFTNSSTNSYHRLVSKQMSAPFYRFFSGPNRTAAIRVPSYARTPDNMRFEYRVPDGATNPYLCMSAIQMAAIDGMMREMKPEKMGFGPIDSNIFAKGFNTSKLQTLPSSLDEALEALEKDRAFLQENNVFTPDLIDVYVEAKRKESAKLRGCPHPLEHVMYFGI